MNTVSPDLGARIAALTTAVHTAAPRPVIGRIERISGNLVEARLGGVKIGDLCRLDDPSGIVLDAEVVGLNGVIAQLAPLGEVAGLSTDALVRPVGERFSVPVSPAVLGRVLDGFGRPLDGFAPVRGTAMPLDAPPPPAMSRRLIERPLPVNVRAIDALLTCAEGQRIGIFGGAGAGKSTLMTQIVRNATADAVVVGLIGERGREVREFTERVLDEAGRKRSVIVAATSDRPALERLKAAQTATAIAEWFRDQGKSVVLVIDSLTRLARALREIGLAAGEPPTRRGFPPSVFATLPRLLERAGPAETGTITGFYTVLVEGELDTDPVADDVKAIVDGHIVLSRALAASDHYPAIDILASQSRLMRAVAAPEHRAGASKLRALLQRHSEIELLVRVGEYRAGEDSLADEALAKMPAIKSFLRQGETEVAAWGETLGRLGELAA
ncbi:MAG TPA: FliI/YscN family ATPase [Acidiphilium sp.]